MNMFLYARERLKLMNKRDFRKLVNLPKSWRIEEFSKKGKWSRSGKFA